MSETIVQQTMTADALRRQNADFLGQFLLDNSKFLEEIYHKLKGETFTEEKEQGEDGRIYVFKKWVPIPGLLPTLNDFGINKTMEVLNLSLTANNATGKLDDDVLRILAFKTYVLLLRTYANHFEQCGFKDETDMYMIAHLVFKNVLAHMSKSTDMSLLKELFSSYHISEVRGQKNNQNIEVEPSMTL